MWWLHDITYVGTSYLIWDILKSDENDTLLYVGTSNVFQWSTNPHYELVNPHTESYIHKSLRIINPREQSEDDIFATKIASGVLTKNQGLQINKLRELTRRWYGKGKTYFL